MFIVKIIAEKKEIKGLMKIMVPQICKTFVNRKVI